MQNHIKKLLQKLEHVVTEGLKELFENIVFPPNIGVTNYGTVRLGKDFIADGDDKSRSAKIDFRHTLIKIIQMVG